MRFCNTEKHNIPIMKSLLSSVSAVGIRFLGLGSLLGIALSLTGCDGSAPQGTANATNQNQSAAKSATGVTNITMPAVQFVDATQAAGVNFKHTNGASPVKLMPESVGSGVAFIDYNSDGYQDLYFVNSRHWTQQELEEWKNSPWSKAELADFKLNYPGQPLARKIPPLPPRQRVTGVLYQNNKNGTFSDVTKQVGLDIEMFGMGAAVGDYNNDGQADLYITGLYRGYLFENRKGRFHDVTKQTGLESPGWSTSAAWLDYDRDGQLDLFVCHYVKWTPKTDIYYSPDHKRKSYIGPIRYDGERSHLFHNEGNGRFTNVSAKTGIRGYSRIRENDPPGKGLGVAVCDYNNDGWPDLMVANDMVPNFFYENTKKGGFREVGREAGLAYSNEGKHRAGMGVDAADVDENGQPDIVIGNFSKQKLGLYRNYDTVFTDEAIEAGVGEPSHNFLTFGVSFMDYDNDSLLDIFVANGHVQDDIALINKGIEYEERPLLFHNAGNFQFQEVGLQSGPGMHKKTVARGMAYADYDLDGDLDVAISTCGYPATLLRNDGGNKNNAMRLVLEGTKSNRNALDSQIKISVSGRTLYRMIRSGSSYCSANDIPLSIGLGKASKVDKVEITWPSGLKEEFKDEKANQILYLQEGKGIIKRQGFNE
ncbi:MAG TPA: CRTAC1 family protein, partial [Abditibacteriaceae bacterium]